MSTLKSISKDAVPRALELAERYRLMKEPSVSESICIDILEVDPDNQEALVTLLLAISEQFKEQLMPGYKKTREILDRVTNEYKRAFYEGIINERRALAHFQKESYGSGWQAHAWFEKAMSAYEKAIALHPAGNDEAILRWNNCYRTMARYPEIMSPPQDGDEQMLE